MKDESERKVIGEFVGLKSKMYSKVLRHKMRRIQSKKHKLGTCEINKISLWCFDDKRFVLDDGIHTLAYFHKNRFTSMIINKKRFIKILIKRRDSQR